MGTGGKIVKSKPSRFGGIKYEIKLIGVDKLVWVHQQHLSKGVHKTYTTDGSLRQEIMCRILTN